MVVAAFYLFASILLFSGVMVITRKNPVHSVLFLILAFFNAAGLFVILGAEFLAMLLVVVYVGAVAVLFLFVVMMMNINPKSLQRSFGVNLKTGFKSFAQLGVYGVTFFVFAYLMAMTIGSVIGLAFGAIDMKSLNLAFANILSNPMELFVFPIWSILAAYVSSNTISVFTLSLLLGFVISLWTGQFAARTVTGAFFFDIVIKIRRSVPLAWLLGLIFSAEIILMVQLWRDSSITKAVIGESKLIKEPEVQNTLALGQVIYTEYLYIFQLSGMILLVAMIGAIVLTLRKRDGVKRQVISDQLKRTKENSLILKDAPIGEGIS